MDSAVARLSKVRWNSLLVLGVLVITTSLIAAAQGGSLADAARQARAQKQAGSPAGQAQKIADQLSEDQNDKDAPAGFASYNAGSYKLVVPAPYRVSGHDSAGVVLSGPSVGTAVPMVLVGDPLVLHAAGEEAFHDTANQFVRPYAPSATCAQATVAHQGAYQCSLAGANVLGHLVSGSAVLVHISDTVYPVLCGASGDSRVRDTLNDPRSSYAQKAQARRLLDQEEGAIREISKKCEAVYASLRVVPNAGMQGEAKSAAPAPNVEEKPVITAGLQPRSTIPAGLKVHAFNYCRSRNECWDASVLVPSAATLVSSDCNQYVFEIKVKGQPFLLMTGSEGGDGCEGRRPDDPGRVRWQQLVAPENQRAPGTSSTVSDQQGVLDGKPAIVTEIKFRKGLTEWIGKRAEVQSNGVPLVVGCMAEEDHFNDGDDMCTNLIGSLRLP